MKLLVSATVAVLTIAGCSSGATVTIGDGPGSPFCNDVAKFRDQANALETAATQDLASLRTAADATRDQLVALQKEANATDRVNGHSVKDDLQTASDTYRGLSAGLASADAADPNAVSKVLAGVQSRNGGAFTSATGRLDAYTKKVCKVTVTAITTSTVASGPSTTAPGTAPATTGGAPVGPVAGTPSTTTTP